MKCVRIVLKQTSANYRKPECIENKMTYPLPPISTIIGAIHNACGYSEYHPMDVSIQGTYESMHREPYTDHCFLNSTMNDRGILVKLNNGNLLSAGFTKIAVAKNQTANFTEKKEIDIIDQALFDEYLTLKNICRDIESFKKDRFKPLVEVIKKRIKKLSNKKKKLQCNSQAYKIVEDREKYYKEIKKLVEEKMRLYEEQNYKIPISNYATLTTSLKYYEVLDNINMVIHIKSSDEVLADIMSNINNLTSIGRSEDFVDVVSCDMTELTQDVEDICDMRCEMSAYVNYEDVCDDLFDTNVIPRVRTGAAVGGTVYYMPKNYSVQEGKRKFTKKWVIYLSDFGIEQLSDNMWVDLDENDGKYYIVNFI